MITFFKSCDLKDKFPGPSNHRRIDREKVPRSGGYDASSRRYSGSLSRRLSAQAQDFIRDFSAHF